MIGFSLGVRVRTGVMAGTRVGVRIRDEARVRRLGLGMGLWLG